MNDALLVLSSCANRTEAQHIARALVQDKLAACVQLSAIDSVYRWQGELCEATEVQLNIKTCTHHYPAVEATIKALHSYAVPEIIALPIQAASAEYLHWLHNEIAQPATTSDKIPVPEHPG